jgi:hypothetical protein
VPDIPTKGPAKNKFPFLGRRDARLARREVFMISRYMTDDQRIQMGWIGVPKWEVILGWALSRGEGRGSDLGENRCLYGRAELFTYPR